MHPAPKPQPELQSDVEDPMYHRSVNFSNLFYYPEKVVVEAGALLNNSKQGVLVLNHIKQYDAFVSNRLLKTPEKHGKLTITGFQGWILELQAEDGTKLTFDIEKETFKN